MAAHAFTESPRLVLWVPEGLSEAILPAALTGGSVAAVVLDGEAATRRAVELCQAIGAAALTTMERPGADGRHLLAAGPVAGRLKDLQRVPDGAIAGAAATNRHEAMLLGEAGADYVWFGEPDRPDNQSCELAAWWAALFEVPAVVAGASSLADVATLKATGAEFLAVGPCLYAVDDPAGRVARLCDVLAEGTGARPSVKAR